MSDGDALGTLLASPGVVRNERTGDVAATLTLALSRETWVTDPHPTAEPVSVLVSEMLGRGWALLTDTYPGTVRGLPRPPGWSVQGPTADGQVAIGTADEVLYTGGLGAAVPPGWLAAIHAQDDHLAVCVAADVDLTRPDLTDHLAHARSRGQVAAALLPVTPHRAAPA